MPLFPPVTDTLRWDDLVREGRAQLPLVAPEWTDQNTSDPGIALLELVAWLVETDSYRSSAVAARERRLLLELAGFAPAPARASRCLVRVSAPPGTVVPAGESADAHRDGDPVPLTLVEDVAVTGAAIVVVARASADAADDDYRSACADLTREWAAQRAVAAFGDDPTTGDAFVLGIEPSAPLQSGPLDLWLVQADTTDRTEVDGSGAHHSVTAVWEVWDGAQWILLPAEDATASLTRSGRVRILLPAVGVQTLGDQAAGVFAGRSLIWVRCRIASGRHDAPPRLGGIHLDAGEAIAARRYGGASVAPAAGVPGERIKLPHAWCDQAPTVWLVDQGAVREVRVVSDLALAGPRDMAAVLEPDGLTLRFGDGRWGDVVPPASQVHVEGLWTTSAGVGFVRPPIAVAAGGAGAPGFDVLAGLRPGSPAEDLAQTAARAERAMWVHERLAERVREHGVPSLDDLPLAEVRGLAVPERAVTALDLERIALATPGVALARARALPQTDPRLHGLVADGCVTVVVVPWLPVSRPEPTAGALRSIRAQLAAGRTVGTRFFVTGPDYVSIGVSATIVPRRGFAPAAVRDAATTALRRFLHPVTGGSSERGWVFGRTVRRTEILQMLDALAAVDHVDDLRLTREEPGHDRDCGDIPLCGAELAIAGAVKLTLTAPEGRP
ncbi:hypothetical protein [Agromyces bracchium]|uniref:Baseplate assembly protein n=1 Tax=Agromyces bracchium TaxID=88376 RepID=A0A6I3MDQ0_9MICO|nr:hypothetical protein [Agromyces bracchium]MTH70302.1 hypothetical protein [Agromyces bracchium]